MVGRARWRVGSFPEGQVPISRGSAGSYSPKGDLPEAAGLHLPLAARVGDYQEGDCDAVLPACDSVWTLLHRDEHMKDCVAAYGTLVGICRLRRGFLFPEGGIAMKIAAGAVG